MTVLRIMDQRLNICWLRYPYSCRIDKIDTSLIFIRKQKKNAPNPLESRSAHSNCITLTSLSLTLNTGVFPPHSILDHLREHSQNRTPLFVHKCNLPEIKFHIPKNRLLIPFLLAVPLRPIAGNDDNAESITRRRWNGRPYLATAICLRDCRDRRSKIGIDRPALCIVPRLQATRNPQRLWYNIVNSGPTKR